MNNHKLNIDMKLCWGRSVINIHVTIINMNNHKLNIDMKFVGVEVTDKYTRHNY